MQRLHIWIPLTLALTLSISCSEGLLHVDSASSTPQEWGQEETEIDSSFTDAADSTDTEDTTDTDTTTDSCGTTEDRCSGVCTEIVNNDAHCGGCDSPCPTSSTCVDAMCECAQGQLCAEQCVDTTTSNQHCGDCDSPCAGGQICSGSTCVENTEITAVLQASNVWRAAGADCGQYGVAPPASALAGDPELHAAAQAHADDMSAQNFFSHTGSDNSSFVDRIGRTMFVGQPIGENIAAGQRSAQQAVDGWIDSDGHCRNLMNANATKIGIGYATGGPYGTLWVQVFGR